MFKQPFIRYVTCTLLLCSFALSITPKKLLHTWMADHKDQAATSTRQSTTAVGVSGYHCNIDNLVAESPFETPGAFVASIPPALFVVIKQLLDQTFFSQHHFYSELRGPPSLHC